MSGMTAFLIAVGGVSAVSFWLMARGQNRGAAANRRMTVLAQTRTAVVTAAATAGAFLAGSPGTVRPPTIPVRPVISAAAIAVAAAING